MGIERIYSNFLSFLFSDISGQTEKLSTDNIVATAKIFHVSTDFLLCLTDIPFKTNYDIEHLGLSVDAAKMLLKKEYDMDTLNSLLTQPDFVLMVRQLTNLRQGTMEAGVEGMNQMIGLDYLPAGANRQHRAKLNVPLNKHHPVRLTETLGRFRTIRFYHTFIPG